MPNHALADVVVANIHRRYTGVSATVRALMPYLREFRSVSLFDTGKLGLGGEVTLFTLVRFGWTAPAVGQYRIWHARRDVEILLGVFLRSILRQPWKVIFTSAAPRRHGPVLRWIINRSDAIIATSAKAASFLDWHTVVIHHGVDTNWFCPPDESRKTRLQGKKISAQFAIAQFGRIRYSKGTDLFVHAMLKLLPNHPDFVAVISGLCQPEDQAFLQSLLTEIRNAGLEDRILFLGDLNPNEIRDWYQTVSLVVAASRSEGFGLTPLEAFASGCPVIASHAGIWPEVVDREVGELFETGSLDDLVNKLRRYMQSPFQLAHLGASARDRAEKCHGILNEASQINQLYSAQAQ